VADLREVAAAGGGIELTRTQTIMEGATYCDFKYVKRKEEIPR
jgi:hypothetical protein